MDKDKIPPFVHLHVHTEYSMLDGLNRIPEMIKKIKTSGMNAVAITDHGVMHGIYEFWKACKDAEVKPIIGCEIYVSPKERALRQEVDGIRYYHLLLLSKNLIGYHNLIKIVSIGHLEGFYYRPRVDREILEKYSEGIICTSACPASPLGRHILRGESKKAKEWLEFLHGTYKSDFYFELQRHGPVASDELPPEALGYSIEQYGFMKEQSKINKQLIKWSEEYSIPLIATTDAHYLDQEDEFTQEVLFAIKDGKTLNDPTHRLPYKHTYIKTPLEMSDVYADMPEVLVNTQKLADNVENYDITYNRVQPKFPDLPNGTNAKDLLRELTITGAKKKYGDLTSGLLLRIEEELGVIHEKGYDDYFLIVWDMMKWARSKEIIVGARGSVGGSVVAYCLDITKLEPIKWKLYFERFLNPERESPPDIDMDIQDNRRTELIKYVEEKYGKNNFCGIAAFGRLRTRAAIKDVSRVMGIELSIADTLSKLVEVVYGKPKPISWVMENNNEFRNIAESSPQIKEMTRVVSKIEGLCRHVSTHASGYLITPAPNINYVPLQTETGSSNKVITQIEFTPLEYLGLMKVDFLGLSNFSIIDYAIKLIKKRTGKDIDIYTIPENDKKTFKLFQDGDTTAVFQFESAGMKRYIKDLHPENLEDLCFMAAAYRPGPMQFIQGYINCKRGKKSPEYLIPELKPILGNTYGFLIYQEQVIRIAVDIAGYSMGQADILRRAMGKKVMKIMNEQEKTFVDGCIKNGFSKEVGKKLFEYMLEFANYGFVKAHSAAYGVIGYWIAYLKANYPMEFMCARLTADMGHPDKLIVALEEARHMGLTIFPPHINKSQAEFVPEDKSGVASLLASAFSRSGVASRLAFASGERGIMYGLDGIKNVGHNVVEELIAERNKNGDFKSLDDLCVRVALVNSRTLESLIKVGALDSLGESNALLAAYPSILSSSIKEAQKRDMGQLGMFSANDISGRSQVVKSSPLPDVKKATVAERLQWEKDLLGIYFISHPIQDYHDKFNAIKLPLISKIDLKDGMEIEGGCLIANVKQISTKKGDPMAFVTLEDTYGTIDAVLFPNDYKNFKGKFNIGDIIIVKGVCNMRNGEISIIINNIKKFSDSGYDFQIGISAEKKMATLVVKGSASPNDLEQLRDILLENPGEAEVIIHILNNGKSRKFKVKKKVNTEVLKNLIAKLPLVEKVVWE